MNTLLVPILTTAFRVGVSEPIHIVQLVDIRINESSGEEIGPILLGRHHHGEIGLLRTEHKQNIYVQIFGRLIFIVGFSK